MVPREMPPDYAQGYLLASERWASRPRCFDDVREGMEHTLNLARALTGEMGVHSPMATRMPANTARRTTKPRMVTTGSIMNFF